MPRYDFKSLSSQDFEELARDLLQAEWNLPLESFKTGRDRGIDLRYSRLDSGNTIVQCKHFVGSGLRKLVGHLRNVEKPKIQKLCPKRYVLVTSLELTPDNKDELLSALSPYVTTPGDIIGSGDLEGLLSRHPMIERANFKLWLTSTNVLDQVLNNAELCRTEFEVTRVRNNLPKFVQCDALPRVEKLLDENQIAVISGIPGIGKSTLAEIVLYAHLVRGYEPVVIQEDIREARTLFNRKKRQIFYYDDFLGQTFLGDQSHLIERNQDANLIDFMEMVRESPHSRLIMTTREHILSQALQLSERFSRNPFLDQRCIVELGDYSFAHKSRILYNHLYFSDLPWPYKQALLEDDCFLRVIKHKHFLPRVIEWLSKKPMEQRIPPVSYRAYVEKLLHSPSEIWDHAFRTQISDSARHLLLAVYTLGPFAYTVDVEPAFKSLHRYVSSTYNLRIAPGDFHSALRELDGAFLAYRSGRPAFLNPSIRDFLGGMISGQSEIVENLLISATRFQQITNLWRLARANPDSVLAQTFLRNSALVESVVLRLLCGPRTRWERSRGESHGIPIDIPEEGRIEFLLDIACAHEHARYSDIANDAVDRLLSGWDRENPDFSGIMELIRKVASSNWLVAHGGSLICRKILDRLPKYFEVALASDWTELLSLPEVAPGWTEDDTLRLDSAFGEYGEIGIGDEASNCHGVDEMRELVSTLEELNKSGGDFANWVYSLQQKISEVEEQEKFERGYWGSPMPLPNRDRTPGPSLAESLKLIKVVGFGDDDARQLFATLNPEG